jgi:hypothetical protein
VEFSLTPSAREVLKTELSKFLYQNIKPAEGELKDIIKEALGDAVIEELSQLATPNPDSKTVFVIHCLPEISDDAARNYFANAQTDSDDNGLLKYTFSNLIMEGIAENIKLNIPKKFRVIRRKGQPITADEGSEYHNHLNAVSAISGVVSDGAATQFLNMSALDRLGDAAPVYINPYETERWLSTEASFSEDKYKGKRGVNYVFEDEAGDSEKIAKFTREIVAGKGDLVLWAEDGELVHRAIPSKENNDVHQEGDITRIIGVYQMNRAAAQR